VGFGQTGFFLNGVYFKTFSLGVGNLENGLARVITREMAKAIDLA
jgi:hypothetical protein